MSTLLDPADLRPPVNARTSIELGFPPCDVCGKKDGKPGHDCDGGEALRKAARELFAPTVDLIERTIAKAGTGILRGVFEVAFERDALRAAHLKAIDELAGIGGESSKDFHRIGIDSALKILRAASVAP